MPRAVGAPGQARRRRLQGRLLQVRQTLAEHAGHFRRRREAPAAVLGVQDRDNSTQPLGYIGIEANNRLRSFRADSVQHGQGRGTGEGRLASTRGVQHAAEAEQVGAVIDLLAARLLGRHVLRRAGDDAALRQRGVVGGAGQTEVGDLNALDLVFEQNVGRFDVAVDQPLGVRRRQAGGHLNADAQNGADVERPVAVQPLLQGDAGHVFHDQVGNAVGLVNAVDGDDVLVADGGGGASLARKPPSRRDAMSHVRRQHLDRHVAMQRRVERLEHHAHAAPANDPLYFVRAEPSLIGRFRGRRRRRPASRDQVRCREVDEGGRLQAVHGGTQGVRDGRDGRRRIDSELVLRGSAETVEQLLAQTANVQVSGQLGFLLRRQHTVEECPEQVWGRTGADGIHGSPRQRDLNPRGCAESVRGCEPGRGCGRCRRPRRTVPARRRRRARRGARRPSARMPAR